MSHARRNELPSVGPCIGRYVLWVAGRPRIRGCGLGDAFAKPPGLGHEAEAHGAVLGCRFCSSHVIPVHLDLVRKPKPLGLSGIRLRGDMPLSDFFLNSALKRAALVRGVSFAGCACSWPADTPTWCIEV